MRTKKNRMELFSFYDHAGIAAHLEKMASKGWMLERIGTWTWKYRQIEPKTVHFAVSYYPKASYYDPEPSEGEQTFLEFCGEAGWKQAASNAQMKVFYNEAEDPIPLETDAGTQLEIIHKAAKRSQILSHSLLLAVGLLQMVMWMVRLFSAPVTVLADYTQLYLLICWLSLLLVCSVELSAYFLWYRKACITVAEQNVLPPTRSRRWFQYTMILIVVFAVLGWIATSQSSGMRTVMLLSFGYMLLLMLLVNGCRQLLKKLRVSAHANRIITLTVDVVLAFGMMFLLTRMVMNHGLLKEEPADTYEAYGMTWEVYDDVLPLTAEDLIEVDPAGYSKQLERKETFLAKTTEGRQSCRDDYPEQPELYYYVIDVKGLDRVEEACWREWVRDGAAAILDSSADFDPDSSDYRYFVEEDAVSWQAVTVYRKYLEQTPSNEWYIRWEDGYGRIILDWEPTPEQKKTIAEKLMQE